MEGREHLKRTPNYAVRADVGQHKEKNLGGRPHQPGHQQPREDQKPRSTQVKGQREPGGRAPRGTVAPSERTQDRHARPLKDL